MARIERQGGVSIRHDVSFNDLYHQVEPDDFARLTEAFQEYCKRIVPSDCRWLLKILDSARTHGWPGYGSEEAFIRDGLGIDPETVGWALAGLQYLQVARPEEMERAQALGAMVDLGRRQAEAMRLAATVEPAKSSGVRGPAKSGANGTASARGSNHAATLAARLRRDHPEIADRLAAGAFPSVRAACRAAGMKLRETATIRLDDPVKAMATLLRRYPLDTLVEAGRRAAVQMEER